MGHLVNPISMRLGWFSGWTDVWYTEKVYYAEYFHSVLKIRLFLTYFFSQKHLEKIGFFYSHFYIQNISNFLRVEIFLYDGGLEGFIEETFFQQSLEFKNLNKSQLTRWDILNRPIKKRKIKKDKKRLRRPRYVPVGLLRNWSIVVILSWLPL
jgi:hypothetical protein